MLYKIAADLTLVAHLAFILFILFGGLLTLRWRRVAVVHLPTVVYGALIEFIGWTCPLTPLENHFRAEAGLQGYDGGFIEHYLMSIIYPSGLTDTVQIVLGTIVIVLNLCIYGAVAYSAWASGRSD